MLKFKIKRAFVIFVKKWCLKPNMFKFKIKRAFVIFSVTFLIKNNKSGSDDISKKQEEGKEGTTSGTGAASSGALA